MAPRVFFAVFFLADFFLATFFLVAFLATFFLAAFLAAFFFVPFLAAFFTAFLAAFFLATITSSDEKVFGEGLFWVKPCVETDSPPNVNLLTGGVTSLVGIRCISSFRPTPACELFLALRPFTCLLDPIQAVRRTSKVCCSVQRRDDVTAVSLCDC